MSSLALKFDSKVLISIALLCFVGLLLRLYNFLIGNPRELRSKLKKQGINGPPPTLLLGNIREIKKALSSTAKPPPPSSSETPLSHDCASILFPHLKNWREQYGQVFMLSLGNTQILYVDQPDVVRHISICKSLELGKPSDEQKLLGPLLGRGILTSNGTIWAHQRDVFAPELYMDKVKGMMNIISECAISVLNSWSRRVDAEHGSADINIDGYMRSFSGDVISRACFGSNSSKGEEILLKLRELRSKISLSSAWIPGMRYLPTKTNREAWRLEKEVKDLIIQVVKERKGSAVKNKKDLLQMVLERAKKSDLGQEGPDRFILDNCTNIYLAGYETTAVAATWCLMLLASNQQWQARVRYEVQEICQGRIPDSDMLRKMKQLTMVIHESLRLYPPVPIVSREVFKDMKFGDIDVPKGVNLWTMVLTSHTDPTIWGPDAYKFNPERFANGITGACKLPHMYMPFGVGPRVCLGQHLAMVEIKMLIALILSRFSFSLSPRYIHSPALRLVVEPQQGVLLSIKKVHSFSP